MRPFKLNEDQTLRFHFLWNFISKFFMKEISKNFQILFLFGINIIFIWNWCSGKIILHGCALLFLTVVDLLGNKITTVKNLKYRPWSVWVQLVLKTDFQYSLSSNTTRANVWRFTHFKNDLECLSQTGLSSLI